MASDFADTLAKAIEDKKNDVTSFTWKGPKQWINGKRTQIEKRLVDATEDELKQYLEHCESMLHSTDKEDPGRVELIKIIRDQQDRCTAELYMRHIRKNGVMPIEFRKILVDYLNDPEIIEKIPRSAYSTTAISAIVKTPDEFKHVSISLVLDACLCALGVFQRKHITNNFLTKLGLWFTKSEIKEYLSKKNDKGELIDRLTQVRENLNLRPETKLHTDYNGGLSYLEFRAMHNLKTDRYENMNEIALNTLKNKVLPRLEDEARNQAHFWEQKIKEIKKVAELKGFNL